MQTIPNQNCISALPFKQLVVKVVVLPPRPAGGKTVSLHSPLRTLAIVQSRKQSEQKTTVLQNNDSQTTAAPKKNAKIPQFVLHQIRTIW